MKLKHRTPRHQQGQAIVWLMGTLAASAAVMYAVFNLSQATVGKQRAVNAADAAALAGATAQARLLNLMAYNNRGMIANEVFLVQMLSMESWLQYVVRTSENFETVLDLLSLIPPVAPFARPLATVLDKVGDAADKVHDTLESKVNPALIKALELAKTTMRVAHTAIHAGGGLLAENAASSMVSANRSDFGGSRYDPGVQMLDSPAVRAITFAANEKSWLGFTKIYQNNERTDSKAVLLASRDNFSASRPGQPWFNFSVFVAGLEKRGGSTLEGFTRWETQDTFESWTRGLKGKDYVPIGWGRANADRSGSQGKTWSPNRTAQNWARSDGTKHNGWSGVPALYDIKDKTVAQRDKLELGFIVAVARPAANDQSTTHMNIAHASTSRLGSADMPAKQAGDQNSVFAKAHVFFERPRRGLANDFTANSLWRPDSAKEYGSLYSPYWQARLTDLSAAEKTLLYTATGLTPDKALYTVGGQ